jgi:hypothetical protein
MRLSERRSRRLVRAVPGMVLAGVIATVAPASPSTAATRSSASTVHAASTTVGWVGRQLLPSAELDSISCPPGTSVCVAAGGLTNGSSLVERTTDRGSNWVGQTFGQTANIGTFDDVSCPDSTHCLASGGGTAGTAFATTDGTHWTQSTLPAATPELNSVSCTNDAVCYVVSYKGASFYTTNFGQSWTAFTYPTTTPGGGTFVPVAIRFQNGAVGFMVGLASTCSTSSCPSYILKTTNFGASGSWSYATTPGGSAVIESVACSGAASNDCVATGDLDGNTLSWRSTDDGANWSSAGQVPGVLVANSVSCPSADNCYVGGNENRLFSSTGVLEDATGVVLHTTNDGASWTVQQVSNGLSLIDGMSCSSALVCNGVGATIQGSKLSGSVIATTNGGAPPGTGYYFVASDGGIFSYGSARFYGSTGNITLNKPVVGMAVDSTSGGYWLVASDGGIFTFGNSRFYGSTGNIHLAKPIVGMATDPATGGYWMVASDGGIFSFNAPYYGSMGGKAISAPIVGMKSMADGSGYYLLAQDGTVYPFGTAVYATCTGKAAVPAPIAAMAPNRVAGGYWEVNTRGQVSTCGPAGGFGDLTGHNLARPIVGMSGTPDGRGYWMVATDGGVFAFGDAHFYGSAGNTRLAKPIVAMATVPSI